MNTPAIPPMPKTPTPNPDPKRETINSVHLKQRQYFPSPTKQPSKTRVKLNPETIDDVNLPGISNLFRDGGSVCYRLFWFCILTTCIVFTLMQSIQRINYYFSRPIANQIILRLDSTNFTFPAITICFLTFYKVFLAKLEKFAQDNNKTELGVEDVDELWNKTYNEFTVKTFVACTAVYGTNSEECGNQRVQEIPWLREHVTTALGGCVALTTTLNPEIVQKTGFIRIGVRHSTEVAAVQDQNITEADFRPAGFYFYLHSTERNPNSYYSLHRQYPVRQGEEVGLDIFIRNFEFINAAHQPCTDALTVETCWRTCFHQIIQKYSTCSLPQFKSPQPVCNTVKSIKQFCQSTSTVSFGSASKDCKCPKRCSISVYSTSLYSVDRSADPLTSIVTFRPHSLQEEYREFMSYDASALFSDLGGTMGLYLGFCVFTYIELLEFLVKFLWLCLKKKILQPYLNTRFFHVSEANRKSTVPKNSVCPDE